MTIRGTVINRITRVGDVGEPGYTVLGEDVPACKKSRSHDYFHGATQESLIYVMPTCYITRSVYNYLTESERNEISSKVIAVCEDDCIHSIPNPYYGGGQCWALNESKIITDFIYQGDIMTTTHIPDETIVCFYGDILAKIGGWNGIDHLIVDRSDGGPNIWSSNFTVGSCNDDEIDDEIDDETDDEIDDEIDAETGDETDGDEYEPKSELATDLSAIFGDIDTKWIIIAVIALIILGILSG